VREKLPAATVALDRVLAHLAVCDRGNEWSPVVVVMVVVVVVAAHVTVVLDSTTDQMRR
jgi:hypothetical protein